MTSSRRRASLLAIQTLGGERSSPCAEGSKEVNAEAGKANKFQQKSSKW